MSLKSFDKSKYKVKEILQNYLSLEKRGRNFWAVCPFHDDTSPSLSISEEKNIFKCFSCGVAGDGISFIMKKENISLKEALYKAHILLKLPLEELNNIHFDSQELLFKRQLLKFNEFLLDFFESSLHSKDGKEALEYLKEKRKLSASIIKEAKLGFAPTGAKLLASLEQIKKISHDYQFINEGFLLKTGIFMKNTNNSLNSIFPIFQNRIIFPIFSKTSEIIGFSSRKLEDLRDNSPKYIHSQETALFKKTNLLYNLQDLTRVNKEDFIYLFEGFFDLLVMKLLKPNNICLALLGSEISNNGLKLLSSLSNKKIVLVLDNDRAGKNATLKLFQKLLKNELNPYILPIEYGNCKDLAEMYATDSSIALPEPILYIDWIKKNWRNLWEKKENITDIISINQIVDFLLSGLFQKNSKRSRIFLFPELNYEFAISQLSKIFDLYQLIEKTSEEEQAIEKQKKKYIEAINLSSILSREDRGWINNYSGDEDVASNDLVHQYSSILEIIEECKKDYQKLSILAKEFSNWESPLLFQYFENYQLNFTDNENSFLIKIRSSIEDLKDHLSFALEEEQIKTLELNGIIDFLELYYCLVISVIRRVKNYIVSSSTMGFPDKYDLVNQMESEELELKKDIVKIFKKLLELEEKFKEE
ncbi:DNA primase [Mycoplasma parvum]|uniref:Toprim domain-containing protein n=1 Tax=Mycoplasma parvum str. Indiana TaxID=1403316 RepID=U5NBH1_9MOLU|nr:DNA primase [Mycoplasma parvum]AGX88891.1 hypothetical protein PRV_00615 [Mycoplasma parvum str. Indiana]